MSGFKDPCGHKVFSSGCQVYQNIILLENIHKNVVVTSDVSGYTRTQKKRPNPTGSNTRHTQTQHFKVQVYPYPPETRLQYPNIPESGILGNFYCLNTSDGSATEKVGFGRVREFLKFENSGSGISGMKKGRVQTKLKSRVLGIFGF